MAIALITGANGFVGRALCARMLAEGWQVRGTVFRERAAVPHGATIVPVPGIGRTTDWTRALDGVDAVVHLAARVHVMKESAADPAAAFREINAAGTERLARMAATAGVRRFIFLSTIGVHGNVTDGRPLTEDAPFQPHNDYSRSKLEAEKVLNQVANNTDIETVTIRAPLAYGPGNPGNFLRLLALLYRGWPLPLASVKNRRSFIYLENLVDVLAICATHRKAAGKTYLVSDGRDFSTPELLVELSTFLGRPARLFPFPPGLLRLAGRCAGASSVVERLIDSLIIDPGKIRREIGWTAPITPADGLKAAADWYLETVK